ncbi:hypothetical protein, partial [Serratia marcescens]|uniref:hypothetical protein n=1 Tax=Serratia marcescens TaxID=615 RepID=UPI001495F10B
VILSKASLGPGEGIGFSMSSNLPLSIKAAAFIMRMVEDPLVSVEVITRKNNPNGYFFYFNAL